MALTDLPCRDEPLIRVGRRHPDVDDRHVGLVHRDVAQQVVGRPRLGDDLEPGLLQEARDALAQEHGVVGEHHPPCVAELQDRPAERREVAREVLDQHLVDALEVRQPLQPVRAEIARLEPGG